MFKNMNYAQRDFTIKVMIGVGIFILLLVGMFYSYHHENEMYDETQSTRRTEQLSNEQYRKKQKDVRNTIANTSSNSSDPILRDIGQNRSDMEGLRAPIVKFGNRYYNWSSHTQYQNRASKMMGLLSPSLLRNKKLFGNDDGDRDPDNNMQINSVLSNSSVSQVSRNGSGITALVDMYYTTWQNSSSSDDNKHNGSQWLLINLNPKKNQITGIQPLYLNPNAHRNSNSASNSSSEAGSGVQY